ncbi:hypothetical protein BOTBODRAFT_35421 [Botryobasidium botryosum FD-172 SS1]|uniref:Aminoglycoside phosphotransferase domain-containing protein n=1 Tax=Botryobasidium botryosum (strain FD-172 SS1) TaxID=930990 RepID=A0A067M6H5_BOTB1|nr:hypothetical protein BOTBODRAFT_35421 [Botryobasidium botryosum FD-172 SS1]
MALGLLKRFRPRPRGTLELVAPGPALLKRTPLSKPLLTSPSTPLRLVFTRSTSETVSRDEFFDYTSGRWLYNEPQQLALRHVRFDVEAMKRIACEAIGARKCSSFEKLAEGAYNKIFLLKFDNNAEAIVRIPNPIAGPPHYVTASEVATMDYVRTVLNIPVPRVLGWSSRASSTPAGVEYIIMEKVNGTALDDRWSRAYPEYEQLLPTVKGVIEMEGRLLRPNFSAFGSLYYTRDVSPALRRRELYHEDSEVTDGADRFRIGPSVNLDFWRGERATMDIDRGPWDSVHDYLIALARCEQAWIKSHAKPRAMHDPYRTAHPPSAHLDLLERFIRAINAGVVFDGPMFSPTLWHPDLNEGNIFVQPDPLPPEVTGIIDWQHACVGPSSLVTTFPRAFAYTGGMVALPPIGPKAVPARFPDNYKSLSPSAKRAARWDWTRANIHVFYSFSSRERQPIRREFAALPHRQALVDLVQAVGRSWADRFMELREGLVVLQGLWGDVFEGGSSSACAIGFTDDEIRRHREEYGAYELYREAREELGEELGVDLDGWVEVERFEEVRSQCAELEKEWDEDATGGPFPYADGMWSSWLG